MVEHKNVMITATGRSREFPGLIRIRFEKIAFGKKSGTELMRARCEMRCNVGVGVCSGAEQWGTSRSNVACFLVLMAENSGNGFRKMLGDKLSGETGKSGKVSATDSSKESGWCRTAECSMVYI
jgi:hypothetical protein